VRIVVLGASGFVGRHLIAALRQRGDDVVPGSLRDPEFAVRLCERAEVVVNLSGETIAQRWTTQAKARIRSSRVDATRALIDGFRKLPSEPRAYVSASAIGYYGTSETATFVESSPAGRDFLAEVCSAWEAEAARAVELGCRVACVRTGIALGTDGGALAKLLPIFRIGLGGPIGRGSQWYSWVHIDDLVGVYLHAIDAGNGPYNATAPEPVLNAVFTQAFARAVRRPAILPVPEFALRALLGQGADTVVRGQRVLPERTVAAGYQFRFADVDSAFMELFGDR